MPSTATTNVTIGALLDLIGPIGSPPAPDNDHDDDQPAFDSLLQQPAPPPAPTDAKASIISDEPSTHVDIAQSPPKQSDSSQQSDSAQQSARIDGATGDSPDDVPEPSADAPTQTTAPKAAASSASKGDSTASNEQPDEQTHQSPGQQPAIESVVAASLGALAAVTTTPAASQPLAAAKTSATEETVPDASLPAAAAAAPKQVLQTQALPTQAGVTPASAIKSATNQTVSNPPQQAVSTVKAIDLPAAAQVTAAAHDTAGGQVTAGAQVVTAAQNVTAARDVTAAQAATAPRPGTAGRPAIAVQPAIAAQSAIESQAVPAQKSSKKTAPPATKDDRVETTSATKVPDPSTITPVDGSNSAEAPTHQFSASSHDEHQEKTGEVQPTLGIDSTGALPQTVDTTASVMASIPATAAPPTAPAPPLDGLDARPNNNGTASAGSVTNTAPPPRSRLPAELFSQSATAPAHRPSVEVDATRLLTRVARAFTAAQERDGEIRLRLSPPELGSLRLDVRVQDGALVARLQTETDAARTAIIDNLPALRDRLAEQGVRIERFDVDLMQRQPGGMPDQPGGRQPDQPRSPITALAPPRRPVETPTSNAPTVPKIGSSDGLNVVV